MAPTPWETVAMVATHAIAIPALWLFATSKRAFGTVAFWILALQLTSSILWHLSHPGYLDESILSRAHSQSLDYFMNGMLFTYLLLLLVSLSITFTITIFMVSMFLLAMFMPLLATTPIFSFYLIGFSAFLFFYRMIVLRREQPLRRIDYLQFGVMIIVGASALVLYNVSESCDDPNYLWAHPIWHVIIYLVVNLFAAILVNVQLFQYFGIHPEYIAVEEALRQRVRMANPGLPLNTVY